ncbi:hypothetical protein O181_067301 [Austropuccinia psidii MF-1]|uniref:Uncharacterized protein n=1 Tax=Austropuccinia psidii MF-1 TaxID=1389203 RepID=A0A9Q3EZC0_9BASI|nr:hypothetical protein [Austropuccinia psidii MF-1]
MVYGGPWPKMGPMGSMAILVSKRFLTKFGSKGSMAKIGSGRPNCGLGARWFPPLGPFGFIGLGQKGPNTPMDHRLWRMDHDYGPWAVEAVGGLNGPKPKMMARGPRTP